MEKQCRTCKRFDTTDCCDGAGFARIGNADAMRTCFVPNIRRKQFAANAQVGQGLDVMKASYGSILLKENKNQKDMINTQGAGNGSLL